MGSADGVRCMLMRGGTSKGAYFLAGDLPADPAERDDLLLRIMGSPDTRQIDGIGGAHPLTSKVAVISRSDRADADVDYLFLQVGVDAATVSARQNCGNLLAGVGPFAVERGLAAKAPVRIHMVNSGSVATATFPGADGTVDYDGQTAIAGVPGTAAAVVLAFDDGQRSAGTQGLATGALLPTGHVRDVIDGVTATCVDSGMPVVVVAASELGRTGYETVAELEADTAARATRSTCAPGTTTSITRSSSPRTTPRASAGWGCGRRASRRSRRASARSRQPGWASAGKTATLVSGLPTCSVIRTGTSSSCTGRPSGTRRRRS